MQYESTGEYQMSLRSCSSFANMYSHLGGKNPSKYTRGPITIPWRSQCASCTLIRFGDSNIQFQNHAHGFWWMLQIVRSILTITGQTKILTFIGHQYMYMVHFMNYNFSCQTCLIMLYIWEIAGFGFQILLLDKQEILFVATINRLPFFFLFPHWSKFIGLMH